jgi:ankyrin repeat protein
LIAAGADVNAKEHFTPLMNASRNGHVKGIELLLKAGAKIDQRDHEGKTALMYAAWTGTPEAVKLLIDKGADVNLRDRIHNVTALKLAILNKRPLIADILRGANAID